MQSVSGQTPLDLSSDTTVDDDQPAFSPDGEQIAFRSSRDGGGIFVMGRTGEAVKRITHIGFHPSWSPDGTQLAFTADNVELYPQNSVGQSGLWIVKVSTGEIRRRTKATPFWRVGRHTTSVSPIPTGSVIQRSQLSGRSRLVGNSQTGDQGASHQLESGLVPGWKVSLLLQRSAWQHESVASSYRGSIRRDSRGTRSNHSTCALPRSPKPIRRRQRRRLYLALVTANIQRLSLDPSGAIKDEPAWVTTGSLRWSNPDPAPDGNWLAMYSLVQPEGHLYLVHSDGTGMRQLTSDSAIDRMPRWSPDGNWVAVSQSQWPLGVVEDPTGRQRPATTYRRRRRLPGLGSGRFTHRNPWAGSKIGLSSLTQIALGNNNLTIPCRRSILHRVASW